MQEKTIERTIMKSLPKETTIFKNSTGMAFTKEGTQFRYGLCKGSSDLIGWTTQTITPDMVGRKVAVFTALEVKRPTGSYGATKEQRSFINAVQKCGGIADIVRSIDDARQAVSRFGKEC